MNNQQYSENKYHKHSFSACVQSDFSEVFIQYNHVYLQFKNCITF